MDKPKGDIPEKINGEKQIYCQKPKVSVLGTAPTMPETPWNDPDMEIWAVAQCSTFPTFVRADLLFELHTDDYWSQDEGIKKRIQAWPGTTVMQQHYKYIPRSVKYPIETILEYKRYHKTSLTYMIALAYHSFKITGKPEHLSLYGVHMEDQGEEYAEQRPCCEYWIGRCEDAGMEVFIAGGAVLQAPFLYGYEAYSPYVLQFRQRYDGLTAGSLEADKEVEKAEWQKQRQVGAMAEAEFWLRKAQRGEM